MDVERVIRVLNNPSKIVKFIINIIRRYLSIIRTHILEKLHAYFIFYKLQKDCPENSSLENMVHQIENFKYKFKSKQIIDFLLKTFKYTIEMKGRLWTFEKNAYLLHMCIWGENYSDKFLAFLTPSLLAPGNLPAISKQYKVYFIIHCDEKTKEKIHGSQVACGLSHYSTIVYSVVPSDIFASLRAAENNLVGKLLSKIFNLHFGWKYYLLGCLQNLAMLAAQRSKAYISFLMPDLLLSDGALIKLFDAISDGKKAAVATAFRSLDTKVRDHIKPFYNNHALCLPGNVMVDIAAATMHDAAQYRIVSTNNHRFQLTAQLIFHYPQEIVIRALHYHPLLVDFNSIDKEVIFDFHPIDSNLLCNIIDHNQVLQDQIWVNENPSELCLMEISHKDIERRPRINRKPNVAASITRFINAPTWDDLNKYLLKKRCGYRYTGTHTYLVSDISDTTLI